MAPRGVGECGRECGEVGAPRWNEILGAGLLHMCTQRPACRPSLAARNYLRRCRTNRLLISRALPRHRCGHHTLHDCSREMAQHSRRASITLSQLTDSLDGEILVRRNGVYCEAGFGIRCRARPGGMLARDASVSDGRAGTSPFWSPADGRPMFALDEEGLNMCGHVPGKKWHKTPDTGPSHVVRSLVRNRRLFLSSVIALGEGWRTSFAAIRCTGPVDVAQEDVSKSAVLISYE